MEKIRIFCGRCNEELAKRVLSWIIPGETGVTTEINLEVDPVGHKCVNEGEQEEDKMEKWYLVETPDGAEIGFGSPNSETGLTLTGGKRVHQIACAQYIIKLHEEAEGKLLRPKPKQRKTRKHWKREAKDARRRLRDAERCIVWFKEEMRELREQVAEWDVFIPNLHAKIQKFQDYKRQLGLMEMASDTLRDDLKKCQEQLAERDDQLRDRGNDYDCRGDLTVIAHQLNMVEQSRDLGERRLKKIQEQLNERIVQLNKIYNHIVAWKPYDPGYDEILPIRKILNIPQPASEHRDGSDQDQETESKSNIVLLCQSAKLLKIRSIYETWERKKKNALDTLADMLVIGDILKGDPKDYVDVGETQESGLGGGG